VLELIELILLVDDEDDETGNVNIHGTGLKKVKFTTTPLPYNIGSWNTYPLANHVYI
jgi:hypothetical protein